SARHYPATVRGVTEVPKRSAQTDILGDEILIPSLGNFRPCSVAAILTMSRYVNASARHDRARRITAWIKTESPAPQNRLGWRKGSDRQRDRRRQVAGRRQVGQGARQGSERHRRFQGLRAGRIEKVMDVPVQPE